MLVLIYLMILEGRWDNQANIYKNKISFLKVKGDFREEGIKPLGCEEH